MPREGEVPPGVEEQVVPAEVVHDESSALGQNVIRSQVQNIEPLLCLCQGEG